MAALVGKKKRFNIGSFIWVNLITALPVSQDCWRNELRGKHFQKSWTDIGVLLCSCYFLVQTHLETWAEPKAHNLEIWGLDSESHLL